MSVHACRNAFSSLPIYIRYFPALPSKAGKWRVQSKRVCAKGAPNDNLRSEVDKVRSETCRRNSMRIGIRV
jgi:hypothetical protein